jgi:transposase
MQMERKKYAAEFKSEAVKQVIDKGHAVVDVAKRLGIPEGVLYGWVNKFKKLEQPLSSDLKTLQAEMVKHKSELRRTTEERDILKKAALSSTGRRTTSARARDSRPQMPEHSAQRQGPG